jgi:chitin disaccharide deacetylase
MNTRLIINADDYGLTASVTEAIQTLLQNRAISNTSVMANLVDESELNELQHIVHLYQVGAGVHLNLTLGYALSGRSSLTDSKGMLLDYPVLRQRLSRGQVKYVDIVAETDAQITRLSKAGFPLSHIDSHQHIHVFPQIFWALCLCAQKAGITNMRTHRKWLISSVQESVEKNSKQRLRTLRSSSIAYLYAVLAKIKGLVQPRYMVEYVNTPWKTSVEKWQIVLQNSPCTTCEIFVHPGHKSPDLSRLTRYVDERELEYFALMSDTVRETLHDSSIQLISYHEL